MTLALVTLGPGDLPSLVALERAAQALPWSEAQLHEELTHADAIVRGARRGDALVGYAAWRRTVDELWLLGLAVLPAHRRHGVGRALVDEGPRLARARDARELWLEVRKGNAGARALYEAAGFVVVGERRGYYRPLIEGAPREDAVLMRRPLD